MAYQIDFTAQNYVLRSRRKALLRLLLAVAVVAVAWGANECSRAYHQPTLNMKLAAYRSVAKPIVEMSEKWDEASKEYNAMVRYYRLLWASSPTNFLMPMANMDAPRLSRGFRPLSWTLTTGGDCALVYKFAFGPGDKAVQTKGLEDQVANLVTSVVEVVGGRVDVQGVQHENLLNVDGFNVEARFALPNARSFPAKEGALAGCVAEIQDLQKKVQDMKVPKDGTLTVREIMMRYLPKNFEKGKADFPHIEHTIDVSDWFKNADAFIMRNRIPGDEKEQKKFKEMWNSIADARWPWMRYRVLDNDALVFRTKALGSVADGVRRFKEFLDKRHADCQKKLQPFVEAYLHNDVFNNPFIETDLRDRVAGNAGIVRSRIAFKDEPEVEPAVLVKKDEKFTFTWVRWTLSLGESAGKEGDREANGKDPATERFALPKLADCIHRALTLGPGYALDKVRVDFGEDGTVAGAVLEGLLPVKKVESLKEGSNDVH